MTTSVTLSASDVAELQNQEGFDDQRFAVWLQAQADARREVVIVHNTYLWKAFAPGEDEPLLIPVDPDSESKRKLKALARKNLLKTLQLPLAELSSTYRSDVDWQPQLVTQEAIDVMAVKRLELLGRAGRGQAISESTAFRVWAEAGCRCMFEGCGMDLAHIPLYNKSAKVGYLAHIVASDPRGPRGNSDSHALADAPGNIMLMCDAHHRLIDSFAVEDFDVTRLCEMRANHVGFVRRHLEALALPRVKGLTLLADLGNVPTNFHEADAVEAVLETGGNLLPNISHQVRRTQRDDRDAPGFWASYLRQHELDIARLALEFSNAGQAGGPEFAIFPIHHTPTMVLAGRMLGEAQLTRVYQYDRDRKTWCWDNSVSAHPAGTFISEIGEFQDGCKELLLTIELTATLAPGALPLNIADAVNANTIPRARITLPHPNNGCIRRPEDLAQFVRKAREVIATIQDTIRPQIVHLIAMAPASSVFSFGQLLQAGNHAAYTLYDRPSGQDRFIEAFRIDGHLVHPPTGSDQQPMKIR
ncbi:hypothetical protein DA70_08770 [Pandoraea pnomenusa]|uniref:SAVED domain-containing protein n=1 Tax=Pandoraea pnomenusa TaxID=93220 RepID=UPI0004375BF7|nr:SAVED domain-containing protein [Pandoraea pnomenusa]AHN74552.1 hypothetical protein DA70_08770 [Pandoraea pnomenusa]